MPPSRACVAAGDPATSSAGAEILRAGGNAVDAAVAAACMSFMAEPVLTGAGGGGFLMLRRPDGSAELLDGFCRMPERRIQAVTHPDFRAIEVDFGNRMQTFHIGRASVAVPGLMALLFEAHRRHGRIPMREVLAPAIEAGRNGVRLSCHQASFIRILEPIVTAEAEARNLYAPGGALPREGEVLKNPDLAALLELLAIEGVDEMYRGDVGRAICDACKAGGLISMRDLESMRVMRRQPLRLSAFGGELITNPPPSSGGTLIAFTLKLLQCLREAGRNESLNVLLAECLRATSLARGEGFDRRLHQSDAAARILHPDMLMKYMNIVMERIDHVAYSPSSVETERSSGGTTHISVLDRDGCAVSLTASNGEGSGIVVPDTGIHLNNMLGEEDINPLGFHRLAPGETLSSMMAPSIFTLAGRPALILGSGGSNRLRSAILQVLCYRFLAAMDIETAVCAGRLHNEGDSLDCEPGALDAEDEHRLEHLGWHLRHWREPSVYFGGVHAIAVDADGQVRAAADPRRGGTVAWA